MVAQIDTLKERLKTKDAKAAENSTKFRNFEAKAAEKDRDLESKANENSVLNVKIRTLEAEVAKKDEEAEELRRDKSRLQDCANELKKGNACLKEQVQQLKSSAEAAKQGHQATQQLRQEKAQLQDRVDEVTKENASLAEQIQQLKSSAEITGFQKTLVSKHKANQRDNSTVDKPNHDDRASTSAVPETQDQPTDLSKAEFERRLTHTTSIRLKGRDLLATLQADAQVLIWLRGGGANIVYSGTDDDDVDQAATALRRVMWDGDEARVERKDGKPIIEYNFGQPVGDKEMLKLLRKIT